jgi:sugar-specific transcriptional regulator TrmB
MMARMVGVEEMDPEDAGSRRALLAGAGGQLYRRVVESGWLADGDPRTLPDHPEHDAFEVLRTLGLLRRADGDDGWVAVDPSAVGSSVVAPLGRRATDLLEESAAWSQSFAGLSQIYRTAPASESGLTQLNGIDTVNRFLESAVEDARSELLTAHPAGPRRAHIQDAAKMRDRRALKRGVAMRTLYQHTARHSQSMREYVDSMRGLGAQIRTLDEFFNRLIIIDRRLALIPGDAPESALLIEDQRILNYLIDIFERSWERGRDYERETRATASEIAWEVKMLTVRMLTEGHSDSASAKRVGVSTRTYASYVAALKEEYGVETRFQLGFAMGRAEESAPEKPTDPSG